MAETYIYNPTIVGGTISRRQSTEANKEIFDIYIDEASAVTIKFANLTTSAQIGGILHGGTYENHLNTSPNGYITINPEETGEGLLAFTKFPDTDPNKIDCFMYIHMTITKILGRISAEVLAKFDGDLIMISNVAETDRITDEMSGKPAVMEGCGRKWQITDANGAVIVEGLRTPQECGKTYGHFRWLSREGVMKEHVFEIRNQRRAADALGFFTLQKSFDVRKAQSYGFVGYIDGLCDYDKWYYSDIITSSRVEFSFSGIDEDYTEGVVDENDKYKVWRVVDITTNEVEIYDGTDTQRLEFDVTFANYDLL